MISILAESRAVSKRFPVKGSKTEMLHAVSCVDLAIYEGETLALVGESGCGKTTLGRLFLGLEIPSEGEVFFDGASLSARTAKERRRLSRELQPVFQDTAAALNPRLTVEGLLLEPLKIHRIGTEAEQRARVSELLKLVGLSDALRHRAPHALSGGQRQRVGIARALALEPRLLVCDEPVSSLDVSVQAQMLNLLKDLQEQLGLTYLFISHDLGVVRHIATRVCVMFLGRICEVAPVQTLFAKPLHPYTRFLLRSVPLPDPSRRDEEGEILLGELPSPVHPPSGCRFRTRCPYATARCATTIPELRTVGERQVACHHVIES